MPAKWSLIDRAVLITIKWHPKMLKFNDAFRRFSTHKLDRVLISQPIRALNGVVHVPMPTILAHICERGTNATLGRHGVRSGRKHFGQHRDVKTSL
jgi:hypothetical protein